MYFRMFKFYELCLFSHSNLALQFRLLLLLGVCVVFLMSWFDLVGRYVGLDQEEGGTNGSEYVLQDVEYKVDMGIDISEILPNCGIKYLCGDDEFPVHIYTGQDKDDQPRLCVGGKYVHGVGRGLNIALVRSPHSTLKSIRNFDLYTRNSTGLEVWLERQLDVNDIIIAFTFDEASKELSKNAKAILYLLGSGKIQDLQFRCQWYMVSRKGIEGFTPLEEITYGKNLRWGKAIDKRLCVPKRVEGRMVSPDPYPRRNPVRQQLCESASELRGDRFCDSLAIHEPFIPSQLTNRSLLGNVVFLTPILVVAPFSLSTLALTLETLVYQPGIQPSSVFVLHTHNQKYVPLLVSIFNFKSLPVDSTFPLTSNDKIEFGLNYLSINMPSRDYVIVLEESLLLSWDFLFYMAQLAPLLYRDESLLGISAWNPYGYATVSGDAHLCYRAEDFPGLGFMMRMSTYVRRMRGRMHSCCHSKSFRGWNTLLREGPGWNVTGNILVPDVSRVMRRPADYYSRKRLDSEFHAFTSPRLTNTELNAWIEEPDHLLRENYTARLQRLINSSITVSLSREDLIMCDSANGTAGGSAVTRLIRELRHKTLSIFYREGDPIHTPILKSHLRCFDVHIPYNHRINNLYQKVLRLRLETNNLLLVEISSPLVKRSPL